ncbi:MAG: O-Antigen ligase [Elusimicrobia bacterium ADurb.Bin231]|nr:MAG: O-Antigen ligase [Elusimicrobia bacterium ADurb.Bin231]
MTNIIESLLVLLIVLTPLAFGTVDVWAISLFEFIVAVAAVLFIWKDHSCYNYTSDEYFEHPHSQNQKFNLFPFLLCIFIFLAIILFQMIPFPASLLRIISSNTAGYFDRIFSFIGGWTAQTITFDIYQTQFELYKLLSYALAFFIIIFCINTKKRINRFIFIIFVTGFAISIFGIIQKYGYNGKLYWIWPLRRGEPFGPFVNRDHFGGYINLIIPLGLGYLLTNIEKSKKILVGYITVIMITALVISLSRGAVLSFLGALIFFTFLVLMFTEVRKGKIIIPITAIIIVTIIFLFWLDWGLVIARLKTIIDSESGIMRPRLPIWIDSLKIIKDFPLLGIGYGNFQNVFPLYQKSHLNKFWRHTHNDYLQSVTEMGAISVILVLAFYCMLVWYVIKLLRESEDNWKIGLSMGAITSCLTILLHSFVDFNLRTTSNAFLFAVITGLTISILTVDDEKKDLFSLICGNKQWMFYKIKILFTILIVFYISFSVKVFVSDRYYQSALGKKEIDAKISGIEMAVKWNKKNPVYKHQLALLYQQKASEPGIKPYDKYKLLFSAKKEIETAIELSPAQIKYLASYGWLLGNLGRYDEAIRCLDTAVELNPDLKPASKLKKEFLKLRG